ncbi:MAG: dolichyl-phosphate beta-glucosyltransferase [Candidatus Komeilibacteria bacterium]
MSKPYLSIIIPVYNEASIIQDNLTKILRWLEQQDFASEVIVSDDGSGDNTVELASKLSVKIIKNYHQGKGAAVTAGMLAARGQWRIFMDIDLATPISELTKCLEYSADYDIIIASRALPGSQILYSQPWYKVVAGKLGNLLVQITLLPGIHDSQCGFKLFSERAAQLFNELQEVGWSFDMELLYLAKQRGFTIKEIPVQWRDDGRSHVKLKDYFGTLISLFRIRFRKK